ncbi:hypothetical protein Trydic_g10628 [Trypoxylus dichotomus]
MVSLVYKDIDYITGKGEKGLDILKYAAKKWWRADPAICGPVEGAAGEEIDFHQILQGELDEATEGQTKPDELAEWLSMGKKQ